MSSRWTLHVDKLAKIETADVEIAPLICFVGSNNSGKSYLMSLLWGILMYGKDLFPKKASDSKAYRECERWIEKNWKMDCAVDGATAQLYLNWFNELLALRKNSLLQRIFNRRVSAERIELRALDPSRRLSVRWNDEHSRYSCGNNYVQFPIGEAFSRAAAIKVNSYICWNLLMEDIAGPLLAPVMRFRRLGEPLYLPASRTGFMLTYKQLIAGSLSSAYIDLDDESLSGDEGMQLTAPYVDFLQVISQFDTSKKLPNRNKCLIEFMEKDMIGGRLAVRGKQMPSVLYTPEGASEALPLYASSSIVSELSPLLLTLQSNIKFKTIIIEEPEAHLHPALQQRMAQFILRLMHSGWYVWITTHSDTILQHINNMIKLQANPRRKALMEEYQYDETDLLHPNDVRMYQFDDVSASQTALHPVERTPLGFVVPTFNDALDRLLNEVYAFGER